MLDFIFKGIVWVLAIYGLIELIKTIIYTYTYTNLKSNGIYIIVAVKNQANQIEGFIRTTLFRIIYGKEEHIKNPNTTIKYATDNATYFFKYKDLMVLSNYLKKDDAIKETKNIIFKANHTLANDKRNGHWAASVIYGFAKTMLSSDLKEYSKDNQRKIIVEKLSKVYTYDELEKILDKGSSIDSGDSICEIIDYDDSDSR